ncbi:uncharacterized protein BDZ99DRAFT_524907 [Mytilinidion resinicola]|uniref:AMP-activated protein kinase glycogen-binding domain-containing protein n=1 Tax=Mytilinidion resinicola TaxID=574789 RepID=A0A6A6YAQ8_9PEZI|nr:uncharacterized protein BDZ99DRAFT_524907 [Mytilinidion resinicola]KAF2805195.1 hypothetical protein BDZ99DRAFT_524907 [Mytilinidion resinicola]
MGSYTFTWEHSANEVFVTGTFDDWKQSVKLEKEGGIFKKTVELPKQKVEYKFVVDGNWVTNDTAPGEYDGPNYNNILLPDDIKETPVHTLSSAAPASSTAALAGAVPKEKEASPVPGAFPETPATEPNAFSVNPIPATEGLGNPVHLAPGEKVPDPSTLTNNTIQSTVKDDEPEERAFGVNPIPATAGAGNPIHLAPGEKVPDPSTLTSNTISSTAKTDEKSYEASDAAPPQLGPVVTPEAERETKGGMFGIPPIGGIMIPESSLPMGAGTAAETDPGVTIQSAAPLSSTAALAGAVPKEPKGVPEVVSESQQEANFSPEASANSEAVLEKKEVEEELKAKVPEEPPAADSSSGAGKAAAIAGGAAAGGAAAFAGATYSAKDTAARIFGLNGSPAATATTSEVPEVVTESQIKADVGPEATANPVAVEEKQEVEQELLKEIKTTNEAGEPAPTAAAEATEAAPEVPEVVAESQKEAEVGPEAAANPVAVEEKKEVEQELLKEVKTTDEAGEPAPTVTAETSATAPVTAAAVETPKAVDSRDISPMSKQPTTAETAPVVTTGVESSKVPAKSTPETPKKNGEASAVGTPESVASTDKKQKKKNRLSFFGKLKEKFHHDK